MTDLVANLNLPQQPDPLLRPRPRRMISSGDSLVEPNNDLTPRHARWIDRLASMFGLKNPPPLQATLHPPGSSNTNTGGSLLGDLTIQVGSLPEEAFIKKVEFTSLLGLTGANTDTRTHKVTVQSPVTGGALTIGNRNYVSGVNLTQFQPQTICAYNEAKDDVGVAYLDDSSLLSSLHPWYPRITYRPTLGRSPTHTQITYASLHGGSTGLADSGGLVSVEIETEHINLAKGGSQVMESGMYEGGIASLAYFMPPNRGYGIEVVLTATGAAHDTTLTCVNLLRPIPSGYTITFNVAGSLIHCVTRSETAINAQTIEVNDLGGTAIPQYAVGIVHVNQLGYDALVPLGIGILAGGVNDINLAIDPNTLDVEAWSETQRARAALLSCPYRLPTGLAQFRPDNGNGAGAWTAVTPHAGGAIGAAHGSQLRGYYRWSGTVGSTKPTLSGQVIPPSFRGGWVDVVFAVAAGTGHGGTATLLVDGANPDSGASTINTDSISTNQGITAVASSGTVSSATVAASGGNFVNGFDGGLPHLDRLIEAVAGTGSIPKPTFVIDTSGASATLSQAGNNGNVGAITTYGYIFMVKRIRIDTPGAHTLTIRVDSCQAGGFVAPFLVGFESDEIDTPIQFIGVPRNPFSSAHAAAILDMNAATQAVIDGTHVSGVSGNSQEAALPSAVLYLDTDTELESGHARFFRDGLHFNALGAHIVAAAAFRLAMDNWSDEQLSVG